MRVRFLRWMAPLVCLAAIIATLAGAFRVVEDTRSGNGLAADGSASDQPERGQGAAGANDPFGSSGAENGDSSVAGDAEQGEDEADALSSKGTAAVSSETFLTVLDAMDADGSGVVSVAWEDEAGLVSLAGDVLAVYRDCPDARLQTSGYLDLKGNAWGAIVTDGSDWVDTIVVFSIEDGGASAQVARLLASGAAEDEG